MISEATKTPETWHESRLKFTSVPYLVGGFKFQPIWKDMNVQNGFIFPKWLGVNIQNVIWNHLPRYSWLVNYGWCETLGLGLDHPNPLRVEPTHFRYSDTIQLTHNAETRKLLGGWTNPLKQNMSPIGSNLQVGGENEICLKPPNLDSGWTSTSLDVITLNYWRHLEPLPNKKIAWPRAAFCVYLFLHQPVGGAPTKMIRMWQFRPCHLVDTTI